MRSILFAIAQNDQSPPRIFCVRGDEGLRRDDGIVERRGSAEVHPIKKREVSLRNSRKGKIDIADAVEINDRHLAVVGQPLYDGLYGCDDRILAFEDRAR